MKSKLILIAVFGFFWGLSSYSEADQKVQPLVKMDTKKGNRVVVTGFNLEKYFPNVVYAYELIQRNPCYVGDPEEVMDQIVRVGILDTGGQDCADHVQKD